MSLSHAISLLNLSSHTKLSHTQISLLTKSGAITTKKSDSTTHSCYITTTLITKKEATVFPIYHFRLYKTHTTQHTITFLLYCFRASFTLISHTMSSCILFSYIIPSHTNESHLYHRFPLSQTHTSVYMCVAKTGVILSIFLRTSTHIPYIDKDWVSVQTQEENYVLCQKLTYIFIFRLTTSTINNHF